jgi:acetylornithine deacetylase/succinyl-diaminopimelate desuccinylase-like protein
MAVAHGPDESIDLEEYLLAIRALARLVASWCGLRDTHRQPRPL